MSNKNWYYNRKKKKKNKPPKDIPQRIKYLSPEDVNAVITAIDPHENRDTKTLKVRLIFSSQGERRFSQYYQNYDAIIEFIKQNKYPGSEDAIKRLERMKSDWESFINGKGKPYANPQSGDKQKKEKEYKIAHTNDSDPLFVKQYLSYEKAQLPENQIDIYIGLDFGTSFTKIAYLKDKNNKGVLHIGSSCFKPTVVYYNDIKSHLSFFEPKKEEGYKQIRFFKATMVKEQLEYNALRYKDFQISGDFEFLCSVFFLANIIRYSRNKLGQYFKCTPDLYITMGIPLFKNKTGEILYNKALHAAVAISEKNRTIWNMSISDLRTFSDEALTDFNNDYYDFRKEGFQNGTMPELFAESLYLLGRRDFAPGYYYIVDIGGGTADFAFIHKDKATKENSFWYYCPSRAVVPLGNEVRKASLIDKTLEDDYHDKFHKTYLPTITGGRNALDIHGPFTITRLLFGGGAVDPMQPYQTKEPYYRSGLHFIQCKVVNRDVDNYRNEFIPDSAGFSSDDRQRLIIATKLADPESRRQYLMGNPWDYDTTPKKRPKAPDPEGPGYDDIG